MKTELIIQITRQTSKEGIHSFEYKNLWSIERDNLIPKTRDIIPGDRIYIDGSCSIPRIKLRPWCKENNVLIVHDIKDATKVIMCEKTIDKLSSRNYSSGNIWSILRENINKFVDNVNMISYIDSIITLDTFIIYNSNHLSHIRGGGVSTTAIYRNIVTEENLATLSNLLSYDIVHADTLVGQISDTSKAIMLEKDYKSIQSLLESKDINDNNLAVEAMCNYNFDKSAVYLLFLYKKYKDVIRYTKIAKTVNYKAFMTYFRLNHNQIINREHILEILDRLDLITDYTLAILYPVLLETYTEALGTKYFTIESIQPTSVLLEAYAKSKAQEQIII